MYVARAAVGPDRFFIFPKTLKWRVTIQPVIVSILANGEEPLYILALFLATRE